MVKLCERLLRDGHELRCFALDRSGLAPALHRASCREAVRGADCVILPLPVCAGDGLLTAPLSGERLPVAALLETLDRGCPVCGGRFPPEMTRRAAELGLVLKDYFLREELTLQNAALTAEGTIQLLLEKLETSLADSRVLVVGGGRIGSILALRLKALGASVAVSVRRAEDAARVRILGCEAADTRALEGIVGGFDAIVNTVPAPVLPESLLGLAAPGALILDLASAPGGVDMEAAGRLGLRAMAAPGLPGKCAPASAGRLILETIYNILEEISSE